MTGKFTPIAKADEVAEGETVVCEVGGMEVIITRYAGCFYAVENECTHALATFDGCKLEDKLLRCPAHGAEFDVTSGEACSPPAYEPLRVFEVRERNGMVEINHQASV